uniref:Secreted protein n=1 Tax=Setaria viridis TaxID=4556 RepID=A0A4U6T3I6_SETVI|nr:hypothetical protein SEVIR_9G333150v2 [Setaria viridis]
MFFLVLIFLAVEKQAQGPFGSLAAARLASPNRWWSSTIQRWSSSIRRQRGSIRRRRGSIRLPRGSI